MAPLHILIVTLDPKKDSPTVLKKYASQYNLDQKNVTLVTGALKSLSDFASEFNVVGIPGRGTISHNIRSILLGPDLKPLKKYDENSWTADQVLSDIEKSSHKLG